MAHNMPFIKRLCSNVKKACGSLWAATATTFGLTALLNLVIKDQFFLEKLLKERSYGRLIMDFKSIKGIGTGAMLLISIISISLSGCSNGSSDVSSQFVSGVAAAGSPLSGTVSLKDASSTPKVKTTNIASDGTYAIDVTGMQAPFIIEETVQPMLILSRICWSPMLRE
jgi:hypothetical protein